MSAITLVKVIFPAGFEIQTHLTLPTPNFQHIGKKSNKLHLIQTCHIRILFSVFNNSWNSVMMSIDSPPAIEANSDSLFPFLWPFMLIINSLRIGADYCQECSNIALRSPWGMTHQQYQWLRRSHFCRAWHATSFKLVISKFSMKPTRQISDLSLRSRWTQTSLPRSHFCHKSQANSSRFAAHLHTIVNFSLHEKM